jgi:hypothetical protein
VKLSTEAAMAAVGAPLMVAWELTREGKEKGKERRGRGARPRGQLGRGAQGGCKGEVPWGCYALLGALRTWLLFVREKGNTERKEKRRKEKGRKEKKEKNMEIFINLKIFKKIKDIL